MRTRDGQPENSMVVESTRESRDSLFAAADLDRLVACTFVEQIEFHRQIGSTNQRALLLTRAAGHRYPLLVLAEHQTAGRGRGANRWWGARGALTFSLILEGSTAGLPQRCWPQVSLTTGLAVCEALQELPLHHAVQLKWPNDVYLQQRKLCGVLLESSAERSGMLILGIGLNVNNSLRNAPQELQSTAIALTDATGTCFSLSDVLERVLLRLDERLRWIGCRDEELLARWRERCFLTGRTVRVDQGGRRVSGYCRGIDEEGALLVETEAGPERCFAGVVTHF